MSNQHPEPTRGEIRDRWLECAECGGSVEIEARMHSEGMCTTTYRCGECGSVGVQRVVPDRSSRRCRVDTDLKSVRPETGSVRHSSRRNPFIHRSGVDITD